MEKLLLKTVLELYDYDSDINTWSHTKFEHNPPRLYRLQMIDSLCKALEINCSYADFFKGSFIESNRVGDLNVLKAIVDNYSTKISKNVDITDKLNNDDLQTNFKHLMEFRMHIVNLLKVNSGVMACSGIFHLSVNTISLITKKFQKEAKVVDQLLCFFINPKNLQYTNKQLVENFGFPDVSIDEVDLDWI